MFEAPSGKTHDIAAKPAAPAGYPRDSRHRHRSRATCPQPAHDRPVSRDSWQDWRVLIAMSGLPGTGKSAIAAELSRELGAVVLSVDTVDSAFVTAHLREAD